MGTQAHWFASKWRFRLLDVDGDPQRWTQADSMEDVRFDSAGRAAEIQRRAGTKVRGYRYVPYGFISAVGRVRRSTSMTLEDYLAEEARRETVGATREQRRGDFA